MLQIMNYIKLLRPKHWIKNALVFLPLVTAHQLFNVELFVQVCMGTIMFCLLSSVVYIFNDIRDVDSDRAHPKKNKRPLASGAVPVHAAKVMIGVLLTGIAALGVYTLKSNTGAWIILAAYFLINVAYSAFLKHIAIADIFALASGYVLRVYFCSVIAEIEISKWLFLTLTAGALFLVLGKRRGEMRKSDTGGGTRKVLLQYSEAFLDKTMYMCEAIAVVFYSLWSIDSAAALRSGNNNTIYTVPFVLLIFIRYNLILERDTDGDPVTVLTGDKPLLIMCGMFAMVFIALLYIAL